MTDLDALEKLLAEATPGPWTLDDIFPNAFRDDADGYYDHIYAADGHSVVTTDCGLYTKASDCRAIVAAVNALPSLIQEIRYWRGRWEEDGF